MRLKVDLTLLEHSSRQLQHLGGPPILCKCHRGHTLSLACHKSKLRLLIACRSLEQDKPSRLTSNLMRYKCNSSTARFSCY